MIRKRSASSRVLVASCLAACLSAPLAVRASAAGVGNLQAEIYTARDRVMPALVHIQPILDVYRMGEKEQVAVTGSGVIFSPDGYVLTNNHVVENAARVTCTLSTRQEVAADLVGRDPLTDLAVLKLRGQPPASGWPHAALGDSSRLEAGQYVLAMGSPLGLSRSLSVGVISSLDRYIPESQLPSGSPTGLYNTWIQTDAAINPGNSGGPLVSLDGYVIGINARAVPIFGENIGFAIPANLAREVSSALIENGEITRSWIGVHWQSMKSLTSFFGLKERRGVVVGDVVRGSPAEEAGLRAGDIVLKYNGTPVSVWFEEEIPAFKKRVADSPVGQPVSLSVLRDGEEQQLSLVPQRRASAQGSQKEGREWGFTIREVTKEMAAKMNLPRRRGVLISGVKPGSFAAEAGLRPGDLVTRVDDVEIEDLEHWSQIYQQAVQERRPQVLITVRRGPASYFFVVRPVYAVSSAGGRRPAREQPS
ncbi:MAG: trypsin-like peptidase domain-containing protein [Acidobacteriota bacterium]